jgi:hypothetical protein
VALFRGTETHARSVLKAVSWRTLGTLDTFAISWLMTGRAAIASSIAGLETKIAWYTSESGQRSPGGTADHGAERLGLSFALPDLWVS